MVFDSKEGEFTTFHKSHHQRVFKVVPRTESKDSFVYNFSINILHSVLMIIHIQHVPKGRMHKSLTPSLHACVVKLSTIWRSPRSTIWAPNSTLARKFLKDKTTTPMTYKEHNLILPNSTVYKWKMITRWKNVSMMKEHYRSRETITSHFP